MADIPLPEIPPQPPVQLPDPALDPHGFNLALEQWRIYRWCMDQHEAAANRASGSAFSASLREAIVAGVGQVLGVLAQRTKPTKADVVLACIRAVPPTIRPTEGAWAADVKKLADELWADMQADPEINPPA